MTFSKGGVQEARGSSGAGKLCIENLIEELDNEDEFFLDQVCVCVHVCVYVCVWVCICMWLCVWCVCMCMCMCVRE